ncbi:velvet factor-domain-containing protein [Phyllosticta citrichinensis]
MLHPQYMDPMYSGYPTYAPIPPPRVCGIQIQQAPRGPSEHQPVKRYDESAMQNSPAQEIRPPTDDSHPSDAVELSIRQQPKEALVTIDGKEKNRKPVDPPPIVQLHVQNLHDPQAHYMQSPYLIMICDLWDPEQEQPADDKALAGTICSSLHRLKDIDNKDGAFFVFGDISIKKTGEYRLRFSLFDILKYVIPTPGAQYEYITSVISDKFRVVSQKEFRGLDESTYLSRAFSDQGVRLRLRKEPRHVMGRKRSPPQPQPAFDQSHTYSTSSAPQSATTTHTPQYSYPNPSSTRSPQQSAYDPPTYPPPTPNASTSHSSQYGGYGTPTPYADHPDAPPVKRSRYSVSSSSNLAVQPPSQSAHWPGADYNYGYSTSTPVSSSNMRSGISSTASSAAALAAAAMGSSGNGGFQSGGRLPVQGAMQGQSPEQAISLPRTTDFNFGGAQPIESNHMLYFGHSHDGSGYAGGGVGGGGGGGSGSAGSSSGRRE